MGRLLLWAIILAGIADAAPKIERMIINYQEHRLAVQDLEARKLEARQDFIKKYIATYKTR